MGTRGAFGVRIDGQDKLMYNHFDSYPSALGRLMVATMHKMVGEGIEKYAKLARELRLVTDDSKPTPEDIEKCRAAGAVNLGVGEQGEHDWYCLMRELQGDLVGVLTLGLMTDGASFMNDSLFCEWAYVVNFDEQVLEIYEGFQLKRGDGRYAAAAEEAGEQVGDREYWPVSLIAKIPFSADRVDVTWEHVVDFDLEDNSGARELRDLAHELQLKGGK